MIKSCSAKRSGDLKFSISPFNFIKIRLDFMGSGTSEFENQIDFKQLKPDKEYKMVWKSNTFIGSHWLLGKFKFVLNKDNESIGVLSNSKLKNKRYEAVNKNYFYFDFNFPRVFNLKMTNEKPIINSAVVFDIPPTDESTFKLENGTLESTFKSSNNKFLNLSFDFCEVTAYPERNVEIDLLNVEKLEKNKYQIRLRYKNTSNRKAKICYFTVIHEDELIISNDYGFRNLKPMESFENTITVAYNGDKNKITVPFFAGLYKPVDLRGAMSEEVELIFE